MRRSATLLCVSLPFLLALPASGAEPALVSTAPADGIRFCFFAPAPQGNGNGVPASQPTSCRDTHVQQAIRTVVQELNALPAQPRGQGSCVRDNGSQTRVVVHYRDGHRERVDVHNSGCAVATHPPASPRSTTHAVRQDVARRAGFAGQVP